MKEFSVVPPIRAILRRLASSFVALSIVAGSTGIFLTTAFLGAQPAEAASSAAILVENTSGSVGQAQNLGISLTGFSEAEQALSYQVTLKYVDANDVVQSNGTLTATQGSTSLVAGYSSYSSSKLGFKGSYAAVSAALASVTWTPAAETSGLTLRVGLAVMPGANQYYDANSGHYYEYVSSKVSWATAKANSAARTPYLGLTGYLAHITSKSENDFVANEMSAASIYIAATDAASEGQWRWSGADIAGESDFVFNTYSSNNGTTNSATPSSSAPGWGYGDWYSGRYSGWSSGEPNNWGGSEDCAVTNWGSAGRWNDVSCGTAAAYLIEYGGAGGEYTGLALTQDSTMVATNVKATWTSPTSPTTAITQVFGLAVNYAFSGLVDSDIENAGTATGCVFTPSASSAAANTSVTVTATECSSGTVAPRLIANSIDITGGYNIPASTATAVTVQAGPFTVEQSTISLSGDFVLVGASSVTLTFTPRDQFGRMSGPGKPVSVSAPPLVVSVRDNGDGSYTATLAPNKSTGTANITITVSGTSRSTGLSVTVDAQPNLSAVQFTQTGSYNQPITSFSFQDIQSSPEAIYSLASGSLPAGVTLNSVTGVVSGTPTTTGRFTFVVSAANKYGSSNSLTNTLTIGRAPTFVGGNQSITGSGAVGSYYSSGVSVASGSYPAVSYAVATGSLPPGISLDPSSGALTGTIEGSGTYSFSIVASNFAGSTATSALSIVAVLSPVMTDNEILNVTLKGQPYSDGVSASAYPDPVYAISSGSLPPGLRLNSSTGEISGTPNTAGAFTFTMTLSSEGWYRFFTSSYSIQVEQAPVIKDATIAPIALTSRAYVDAVAVDAMPTATFAVTAGELPPGISVDPLNGAITGTPTRTGEYSFTVTAKNSRGKVDMPLTLSVHSIPTTPFVTLPSTGTVGVPLNGTVLASGYPAPTYVVSSGNLPPGVSLNAVSGAISGNPTDAGTFTFVVSATNDDGETPSSSVTVVVESLSDPKTDVAIEIPVGEKAFGAPVQIQSEGLAPNADYTVTVRSTPQVVDNGKTTATGAVSSDFTIPSNLEPGWHSITLASVAPDGSTVNEALWFEITDTGILETVSKTEPSATEKAAALADDAAFYEAAGIDPAAEVSPTEVASAVQQVSSVVASVALVSAAAAAAAAAGAAAGAAGSAGAAAGGASGGSSGGGSGGGARTGGGASGGSSGSSSSSGGSGGDGSGKDEGGDDADYGSMEADHDDFEAAHTSWGDRLRWWRRPFMRALDRSMYSMTERTSALSPVLSRIVNDGSYLRAMFGGLLILLYVAAAVLGVVSVDLSAESMTSAGQVTVLSIILVLGTLDALAGLIGVTTFTIVSVAAFGIHSLGDVRYILAMFIAAFAPIILATTFRKIRRPHAHTATEWWARVIDVFMIAYLVSLAVLSVVGGISAFAGATVPLAAEAKSLVFVLTGVALLRIILEESSARFFTGRLDRINPTEVPGPGLLQQWLSLIFKYVVLVLMIGDMVGWGWWLWTGAFILFIPGIMALVTPNLPTSKILTQLIPGGLAALLMATLLTTWSGDLVSAWFSGTDLYGPMSFIIVPLPVIIVAIIGMFAASGDKWYVTRHLTWVYVIGGIIVFAATVWATDFIGQVFGP